MAKGWLRAGLRYAVLAGFIFCLLLLLVPARTITAATGTIDPNGDGTIAQDWGVTPSGTRTSAIDDAVREPSVPNTSDYISLPTNKSGNAFFLMSTLGSVNSVSSIQLWVYHNDGSNGQVHAALYDSSETGVLSAEQSLTVRTTSAWDSLTFSGLSLAQSDLDGLRVRLSAGKASGGGWSTVNIYAMYAVVTYSQSVLSADIVDSGGNPVTSPSAGMSALDASFDCQASTGTLGVSSERIRVDNTTTNGNWTLTLAATGGAGALWSDGTNSYDFNDPSGAPGGCEDGSDTDSLAGQLTVDPSVSTLTPQSGCSASGVSKGASIAFAQGTADSATLLSASGSQTGCYFDLTGVGLSQQVPGESPASASAYTINMTLTVTAN